MSTPMCSASHCSGVSQHVNDTCKANKWPVGHLVLVCDTSGNCCNCTCSCLAWGTEILIPDNQVKVIQDFVVGDPVMACGTDLKWGVKTVEFSHGTGPDSHQPMMLRVVYGDNEQELIVTMDHLFLVPGGKLKRADKLIVGQDFLISTEGGKVEILSVSAGAYTGGVNHIATSTGKPTSLDGHLLACQGIVCADYAVQVYYQHGELDAKRFLVVNHENMPQAGDQENKKVTAGGKLKQAGKVSGPAAGFIPKSKLMVDIPDDARRFFTKAQARELGENAPLYPKGYSGNQQAVMYLFDLFRTFYPQINFLTDFHRDDFNAYSWSKGNKMFVVVCGGITRVKSLDLAGLALIIAHETGHLLANPNEQGEVCEGNADYYAVQCVLRKVFYQEFFQMIYSELLPQISEKFSYITKNRGADRSCNNLSLDCRYNVYTAAGALVNLPVCAGGPALLALEKAENNSSGLVLTFNEMLNAGTAQTVDNYVIAGDNDMSAPKVTKASYSYEDPKRVILTVPDLEKGKRYVVKVSNLLSGEGEELDPEKSSAGFEA